MIITVTDHYHSALEALASSDGMSTDLRERISQNLHRQPAGFIVVSPETMNALMAHLATLPHIALPEAGS